MDYRTGKCSQCGAEYKIPASFAHNVARCKVCRGVVHLSAAPGAKSRGASAPSAPREGAASGSSAPARPAVPEAAARPPQPRAPERRAPAALAPAAAQPPADSEAPRSAATTSDGERRGARDESRRSEGRAEAERNVENDAGPDKAPENKPSPPVGLLVGVGLVVVIVLLVLLRKQVFGSDRASPPTVGEAATVPATSGVDGSALAPASSPGRPESPSPRGAAREPATSPVHESPGSGRPAEAPTDETGDPSSIDLAAIGDFHRTSDTSPAEWDQMSEWMAQWMDVDAGAAGNVAKLRLLEQKRKAVPILLNVFKRQDFATPEGRTNGERCDQALVQICNGTSFDWRAPDEAAGRPASHPDDVWFCKRVVQRWTSAWQSAEQDVEAWIELAQLKEKDPAEAQRLRSVRDEK